MKQARSSRVILTLLSLTATVQAEVRLPAVFSDDMVVQQGMKVPVWGWAEPEETVRVTLGDHTTTTRAAENGQWRVDPGPFSPGPALELVVQSKNTLKVRNILVGEVWLCSGQSNMTWAMQQTKNAKQNISTANYPQIRLFDWDRPVRDYPPVNLAGRWYVCTPKTVKPFSAVGYFFGRELHNELNVPIGIIHASWDGTNIEGWLPMQTMAGDKDFQEVLKRANERRAKYDETMQQYDQLRQQWLTAANEARRANTETPPEPQPPAPLIYRRIPSMLYREMIHPLIPFALRGVLWSQGEANAARAYHYRQAFKTLIRTLRRQWGQGDFPFYFVQVAPQKSERMQPFIRAELREAQLMALALPNTGMVVQTDIIPDLRDGHPLNKPEVGRRLALWALAKTYHQDVAYSGPLYRSMTVEGDRIRLRFDHAEDGLVAKDGPLTDFEIAGPNRQFVPARAVIDNDTIVVSSNHVADPVAVRFGWRNDPQPNLFNRPGLPASPFRTDNWPGVTDHRR